MKWIIFGVAVMALVLAGCSSPTSESPSACLVVVRHNGTIYEGKAPTERPATKFGFADQSACADVGEDPRGVYFPKDPKQVQVWSFDGLDPSKVLGVRGPEEKLYFSIAENVPKAEANEIADALSNAPK